MNHAKAQALFACLLIASTLLIGLSVAQTPPAPNQIQQGDGANMPTVTAQYGYFYGWPAPVNITAQLFGDFGALDITTTGDLYHGAYNATGALYGNFGTNPITTLGSITGTQINTGPGFTEVYPMNQSLLTTDSVDFGGASVNWLNLGGDNRTDWFDYLAGFTSTFTVLYEGGIYRAYYQNGTVFMEDADVYTVINAVLEESTSDASGTP